MNTERENLKEYLRNILIAQKRLIKTLDNKNRVLTELQEKIKYAEAKPDIEVSPALYEKAENLRSEINQIKTELSEVNAEISKIKKEFVEVGFVPNVDADMLEAEFEVLLGDDAKRYDLEKEINQQEVEDELEQLKKDMGLD